MGTGVSPKRIATGKMFSDYVGTATAKYAVTNSHFDDSTVQQPLLLLP